MPDIPDIPIVQNEFISDGVTLDYGFTFPYIKEQDVYVQVDSIPVEREFLFPSTIRLLEPAPAGAKVRVYRRTQNDTLRHWFELGAPFRPIYIDANNEQLLYIFQEAFSEAYGAAGTADLAYLLAQEALARANTAYDVANQADLKASAALSAANEALPKANEALDLARLALELAGGFAQVVDLYIDTVLEPNLTGRWLRMHAPVSSTVRRLTIPNRSDWPPNCEVLLEQNGDGYALIEADSGVTLRTQPGTAPIIRNGQAVACLKLFPGNEWVLFGALEDI